jgi:hypothetical protein
MRITEKVAPVMGAVSAVGTLACCLPIGGTALLGLGGIAAAAAQYQQWLIPASTLMLATGALLTWRSRRVCQRVSKVSVIILCLSTAIVMAVLFFPQDVAGLLTDWLS